MALTKVKVPDIGDFKEVDVIEVLVKPGDAVREEQSLITVESDKATMEIPSPATGVVKELRVKTGDKVSRGSPILVLEAAGGGAVAKEPSPTPQRAAPPAPTPPRPAPAAPVAQVPAIGRTGPVLYEAAPAAGSTAHASPSVRKFARELGVELARVKGSGPK